jgi:apolipoprotein N-acyltransferase
MAALAYALEQPRKFGSRLRIEDERGGAGGLRGALFGFAANLVVFRFVPTVVTSFTSLPWIVALLALALLAAAQGLRWWLAAVVRGELVRRGVPSWAAFAIGVYAGSFFPMIFPWNPAGGATPWPATVQLAEIVGERGVSALMALTAGLLAHALPRPGERSSPARAIRLAGAAAAIVLLTLAHGAWRIGAIESERASAKTAKIALVQPSIGASERWERARAEAILAKLTALTKSAESNGAAAPVLTIWPEAAYPYVLQHGSRRAPVGGWAVLQEGVRGPVLTGAVTTEGATSDSYNSALIVSGDGSMSAPYDKLHLLWFGESVPLADEIPWLRRTFARGVGLSAGEGPVLLSAGPVRASVLNCFEDTLPVAGREAMTVAPNLLVNLTNDAWFAGSDESELHLRMAAMRSVETRRDLVRAVNYGPTSWVDATGRVRARRPGAFAGVLMVEPALLELPPTFFTRFGEWPTALALTLASAAMIRRARAGARAHKTKKAPLP